MRLYKLKTAIFSLCLHFDRTQTKGNDMNIITKIKKSVELKTSKIAELNELKKLASNPLLTIKEQEIVKQQILQLKKETEVFFNKKLRNIDNGLIERLNLMSLKSKDMSNISTTYLISDFIVDSEITMIAGKPGGGKSLTMVAICNEIMLNKSAKYVFYFDFDNSITTLKDRCLDILLDQFNNFLYFTPINKTSGDSIGESEIWTAINELENTYLQKVLIVFDSAKNFLESGADRDKNKDVSPLMKRLKRLRSNGATVIFLHHTNKPQKDINELTYAGSSAWLEDASNAFILNNNDFTSSFLFSPVKKRIGSLLEQAFTYNEETMLLSKIDIQDAKQTKEDIEIRNIILKFISEHPERPTYSEILNTCTKNFGYAKNQVNAIIQASKGIHWDAIKEKENHNRDVYILLDNSDKLDK